MASEVTLPALGESVTEGTVTRWLKQVGDTVAVDEPLLEVSTDKVDTEIPSPVAGTLLEIKAEEDETVEVGAELAIIGSGDAGSGGSSEPHSAEAQPKDEDNAEKKAEQEQQIAEEKGELPAGDETPESDKQDSPAAEEKQEVEPEAKGEAPYAPAPQGEPEPQRTDAAAQASSSGGSAASSEGGRDQSAYVTPLVRKMADQHGIDLGSVQGTGVGGRIRKQDVISAQTAPAAPAAVGPKRTPLETSPLRGTTVPMTRLRKVVAERAVVSMTSTAQLTTVVEVDVTRIAKLRDRVKGAFLEKTGNKLSFLPFFALAAAEALRAYPIVNSTVDGDSIVYPASENMSIAVDTERGLLTPVIRDAGELDIAGLAGQIADLAERTRNNKLKPDELAGGTFTLTNTGSRGALFDTPVVFLPQSAILGTGIVVKRPVVVSQDGSDAIAIRSMIYLALSYDHRIIDGADAARFLTAVKERLEEGDFESDLGI
jgi:pyruvate dehydrogenase E2 component (dihydrolipoamide acetyltransferase)